MSISKPAQEAVPFAELGLKTNPPANSNNTTGRSGYDQGFPPVNMLAKVAGGIPPFGEDMNGILNALSRSIRYIQAGMVWDWNSSFAAAVAGYNAGATLLKSDGSGFWINRTAGNTTDPDSAGAAAAGWVPGYSSGFTSVTMTNANVTLTPLQYSRPVIVITGTLTANLNLIFPNLSGVWSIINATTGAFTITAKTAAGSGAVVTGATSISGDATNIYNNSSATVPDATTSVKGIAAIASSAESFAGTNDTKMLTALKLRDALSATGSAPIYAVRAWVNFNGTGTVAIRSSGNVSSITDNGTGDYTMNFTAAMPDANYCLAGSTTGNGDGYLTLSSGTAQTASLCRFTTRTAATLMDPTQVQAFIVR